MPSYLPLPEKPQHGAGKFESNNAWGGLAGLRFSWETALGWLLPRLGVKLGEVPGAKPGSGGLDPAATAALFATGTEAALEQIGKGLTATQSGVADDYMTTAGVLNGIGEAVKQGARDTVEVKKHVNRRTSPVVITRIVKPNIKAALAPYAKRTAEAEARAKAAERKAGQLEQRVRVLERKTGHTSAVAIPGIEGRMGDLERVLGRAKGDIKRLGKWATIGGLLVLLAEALRKMGANWIRCPNSKRYGKSICGMNTDLLESLIADAILIVSAVSIVDLAKSLQAVESEVVAGVRYGIKEFKSGYQPVKGTLH